MVAQRSVDAGDTPSSLYDQFSAQAELIAKDTLLSSVASLEIVQGLSECRGDELTQFYWRPGGMRVGVWQVSLAGRG